MPTDEGPEMQARLGHGSAERPECSLQGRAHTFTGTHNLYTSSELRFANRAYYSLLYTAARTHLAHNESHTSYAELAALTQMPTFALS
eukprot:5239218-Amphidinium_carterae.1